MPNYIWTVNMRYFFAARKGTIVSRLLNVSAFVDRQYRDECLKVAAPGLSADKGRSRPCVDRLEGCFGAVHNARLICAP